MTKKHFIALANTMMEVQEITPLLVCRALDKTIVCKPGDCPPIAEAVSAAVMQAVREKLADFCQYQNHRFNRERWLGYIAGECGPNGGKIKT